MAKIYKVEMYIVDVNDEFNGIQDYIEYVNGGLYNLSLFITKSESKKFEWDDELIVNKRCAMTDDYNEFFRKCENNG